MQPVPVTELTPTPVAAPVVQPLTFWQRIQQYLQRFNLDNVNEGLGGKPGMLRIGMWFSAGFAMGFLFKKYFKVTVVTILLSVLLIKGLEQQQVLLINWALLKQMIGLPAETGWHNLAQILWSFAQQNLAILIAGVGGFLIGHHLGG